MAWYYGTFDCGHEGRVNITGPTKDRERIAEYKFNGVCEDCYREQLEEERERKNKEAKKIAEELELPSLNGSEKQVAWANTIRQGMINKFNQIADEEIERWKSVYELENIGRNKIDHLLEYILKEKTNATFYIESARFWQPLDFIQQYKDVVNKSEEEIKQEKMDKEMEKELRIESTVFPKEQYYEGVVDITVSENKVSAYYHKERDFIELVKELDYSWNSVWSKKIKETTGSAQERAAELGNKLLNEGFAISIFDEKTRNNAVNGNFELEQTNWIMHKVDSDKLAIKWRGYDSDLYDKAKSLPGSRYSSKAVLVKVSYYKEIEEFADLYGFKFTKAAMGLIDKYKDGIRKADHVSPAKVKREEKDGLQEILESSDEILDDLKDD